MNIGIGTGLLITAALSWAYPGFNGYLFQATPMTAAEGHIMASVFFVGGILAFLMPNKNLD